MSHHTRLHRLVRGCVRPLVRTPVTPNHLTTLRLIAGLAAALALAHGASSWRAVGAGLFLLSLLLDRADGELARQSGRSSRSGHFYDLVSDGLCNSLAFVALGIGLRDGPLGGWSVGLGVVAGVAVAFTFWRVLALEASTRQRAGELGAAAGFDADDALLVFPILIWLGLADYLLLAAAVGAPVFAVFMTVLLARRRRASP